MRRRTLDIAFSTGGAIVAGLVLVLGLVLMSNANFARSYVADQLAEQNITFKPAEALTEQEAQSECLVQYAGQPLTTGKQAECYANEFIGLHLKEMADGMTFAELGTPERELREAVATAQETGDPALPALQQELADISRVRDTVFKGETLRGLLLTTYGFSIFGEKAAMAAIVMFFVAGLLGLLSAAGFVHAFMTPRDRKVRIPASVVEAPAKPSPRRPVTSARRKT